MSITCAAGYPIAIRCKWAPVAEPQDRPGLRVVLVNCVGQIQAGTIMQAIEQGAGEVLVRGCPEDECRHQKGVRLAEAQVTSAQRLLHLLGLDSCRVRLVAGEEAPAPTEDRP